MVLSDELDGRNESAVYQNEHFLSQFDTWQSNTCVMQNRPHSLSKPQTWIEAVWIYQSYKNTPSVAYVHQASRYRAGMWSDISGRTETSTFVMWCALAQEVFSVHNYWKRSSFKSINSFPFGSKTLGKSYNFIILSYSFRESACLVSRSLQHPCSQWALRGKDSSVHDLWAQKHGSMGKPAEAFFCSHWATLIRLNEAPPLNVSSSP